MQRYNNVLRDANGNAVTDATVDIYVGDSLTRATLYDGAGDPVSNPVTTDSSGVIINDTLSADPLDAIGFKAAAGRYRVEGSKSGQTLGPIPDILIGDAQGKDTGAGSGQLPTNADIAAAGTYPKRNAAGTDWESTTPGALLTDLQAARFDDLYADFVLSGLLPATSATLTSDIAAGQAYVTGRRIDKAAISHTYTASVDTYVDLDNAGTYLFTEVANGGAEPAQPAGSIRLAKVVTDAAAITSVADLRETIAKRKGTLDYYLKTETYSQAEIDALSGRTIQRAFTSTGAVVSTTNLIPYDDTIPQITEGGEALSIAFTPKRADSRIRITAALQIRGNAESLVHTVCLFQSGIAGALGVSTQFGDVTNQIGIHATHCNVDIASPGTAATTFSVRFGPHVSTGTLYLNGSVDGTRRYGGAYASTLEIVEYMP